MMAATPASHLLRRQLMRISCRCKLELRPPNANVWSPTKIQFLSSLSKSTGIQQSATTTTTTTTSSSNTTDSVPTTPTTTSHIPIDFQVSSKVEGEESQIATVYLEPGQVLRAESGAMLYMTEGIEMDTHLSGASSAFSRMLTGQNVFLTDFKFNPSATVTSGKNPSIGTVALGTDFPSKILRLNLKEYGGSLICQRGAFLASNPDVQIEMAFTKSLTSGFFGGQGFILQRLVGDGDVLVKAGGTCVRKELQEGESLRVSSGSIVAFTSSVDYDVQMMPGIKNIMFSGEGLFVTTLKGPGTVWLQGMPADRMIAEIASRIPSGMGFGIPIPLGGGGGGASDGAVADAGAADGVSTPVGTEGSGAAVSDSGVPPGDSSGVDVDSPSALFGDALPSDAAQPSTATSSSSNESPSHETSWDDETSTTTSSTFGGSEPNLTTTTTDTDFDQSESFSTDDDFSKDGALFDDDETITDAFGSDDVQEQAAESGQSLLQSLWDFFTRD